MKTLNCSNCGSPAAHSHLCQKCMASSIPNHGKWEVGVPDIFFGCTHGVFPEGNTSLCYTTSQERAELIARWLKEGASAQSEIDRLKAELAKANATLVELWEQYEDRKSQWGSDYLWNKHEDPDAISRVLDALPKKTTPTPA